MTNNPDPKVTETDTPTGTGLLLVRDSLSKTMCGNYRTMLRRMPLKPAKIDDLAGGYEDGFRAAIAALVEMGVIVVAKSDEPEGGAA